MSVRERHAVGVDLDDGAACEDGHAEALQGSFGLRRQRGREPRQNSVGSLDEQDACLARVDDAEVAPQRVPRQLGDLAGDLHAGRAGTDDDEREPFVAGGCVRLDFCCFEGGEEAAADGDRALERLDLRGVHLPLLVTEVRVVRAAGDDQGVVAEAVRCGDVVDRAQPQLASVEVEVLDLRQEDADIVVALEDRPERVGDLARRKRACRDLVRERLEEMEVAAVDERDLDRRAPKLRHRCEAAEASAYDDDVMALLSVRQEAVQLSFT